MKALVSLLPGLNVSQSLRTNSDSRKQVVMASGLKPLPSMLKTTPTWEARTAPVCDLHLVDTERSLLT